MSQTTQHTVHGTPADGHIGGVGASTYAAARGMSSESSGIVDVFNVGQVANSGSYSVWRGFLRFDTSGISGTVIAASLTMTPILLAYASTPYDIQIHQCVWSGVLDADREAKYDAAVVAPKDADWSNTSTLTLNQPATSKALDVGYINTDGDTTYAILSKQDVNNNEPIGLEVIGVGSQDHGIEAYRPFLTITTSAASRGGQIVRGVVHGQM